MFVFHRKALTGISVTAVAVASTALFAMPAQAASAGLAKVVGSSTVQFNALMGKTNGLTITISGRTVTLNDKVAIKAGKGCKAVKGDKTKVKCTTSKKTTKISAALGDKNDWVKNNTSVYLLTDGGSGNDSLTGGSAGDQLQGGSGNDKLYGKGGNDTLLGGSGTDAIYGSTGNDRIDAGTGADKAYGDSGNDTIVGGTGNDRLAGGTGNDQIDGSADNDTIYGDAGDDTIVGGTGNDRIMAAAGNDIAIGETGDDTVFGDAGEDIVLGEAGNDRLFGGDANDVVFGQAGNDTIYGDAGDDSLVGEDLLETGEKVGSDTALDKLDGGSNLTGGDLCLVMAAGTTVNCELPAAAAARISAVAPAAGADSIKIAVQAKVRATTAAAAVK